MTEDVMIGKSVQSTLARPNGLSKAWPAFVQKLTGVLKRLKEDQFLILSVKHSNRFVQFAAQGAVGMRIETTSDSYLKEPERLGKRDISALIDAGWQPPTGSPDESTPDRDPDGSPNFFAGCKYSPHP